jgi:demethylmenaquinone methyltransferase/2-methoxy-6-polyprenyl-1,4-benzoquinol methylase
MRTTRQQSDPNRFAQELFDALPDRYDRLAEWLSFGQNGRWRRAMIGRIVPVSPPLVLDVASGTAGVAIQLARRSPNTRVVATDLTLAMLRCGQRKVQEAGLSRRISVGIARGEQLPFSDATFDALTFTYLLRYVADPQATLSELARVVKPGGVAASVEFCVPRRPVWAASWWLFTRFVLPVAGWLMGGREWFEVGRFLGPSISGHYRRYPVGWHVEAWQRAGFVDVGVRVMSLGGGLVMWGTKAHG